MLDAIKHITYDIFWQEDSSLVHCACSTVQLLQRSCLMQHLRENVIFMFSRFTRQWRSTSCLRWHSKASFACLRYRSISAKRYQNPFMCV